MLERTARTIAALLISCLIFPGCAHFTKVGRQQLAYARYVKKYSHNRVKQKIKFKKVRLRKSPDPSDNNVTTRIGDSPQSVTSGQSEP